MAYDYSELLQRTEVWIQQAEELGWINEKYSVPLTEQYRDELTNRPLMVAFMGGTGVGKSSLLNRLAGQPIAKAGVVRPTSKEVTLFHHQDTLLPTFPFTDICIASHDIAAHKKVIWMDMPDFDSTEEHNKSLVLNCLPYIDVLIYVVSPERYRDDKAWQLLLSEGATHGWLFVMNQWDKGEVEQRLDFERQLHKAGFDTPLIFTTCCKEEINFNDIVVNNDQFNTLSETILSLVTQKNIEQLILHNHHFRIQSLQYQLQTYLIQLGTVEKLKKWHGHWLLNWKNTTLKLQQNFSWQLHPLSEQLVQSPLLEKMEINLLWDEQVQTYLDDVFDILIIEAQRLKLPIIPLELLFLPLRQTAKIQFNSSVQHQIKQALIERGNQLERILLKFVAIVEIVLPLAAMSWVGVQVISGYYESNQTHEHYLKADFAIHSALVCGLSWLIPFFILKKCQPSLKKCALRGLTKGISLGLIHLKQEVELTIEKFQTQRTTQIENLQALLTLCESITKNSVEIDNRSTLKNMILPISQNRTT